MPAAEGVSKDEVRGPVYTATLRCPVCDNLASFVAKGAPGMALGEVTLLHDGTLMLDRPRFNAPVTTPEGRRIRGTTSRESLRRVSESEVYALRCDQGHPFQVPGRWLLAQARTGWRSTRGMPWERERRPTEGYNDRILVRKQFNRAGP